MTLINIMLFIIIISFWIFLYYLDAARDATFDKQLALRASPKDYIFDNHYRGLWHVYNSFLFFILHISFFLTLYAALGFFLPISLASLFLSLGVRIFFRDLFYDLTVGRSIFTVPSCQGTWDFWDCFLSLCAKKFSIPPLILRAGIFGLSVFIFFRVLNV